MPDIERSSTDATRGQERGQAGLCRRLRWKGMFMEMMHDPKMPSMDDGFVWCTHSHNCLGPDGNVADRETCRPGRPCYEG